MVTWKISNTPLLYPKALKEMETRVEKIIQNQADEMVCLLEHPPLYTGGTSAQNSDLINPFGFPVYQTGRGGQYTYHGPGQRVGYVMLDLKKRNPDIRCFVHSLEEWIIQTLCQFGIKGERRSGRVGIWVEDPILGESKIAALGVRVRKWVTYHGIAINLNPDLSHFSGIVPCGIKEFGVTSLHQMGVQVTMDELDAALQASWEGVFRIT